MTASSSLAAVAFAFAIFMDTSVGYLDNVFDDGARKNRIITWKPSACKPVPVDKEVQLLRKDVLVRRGEFGQLSNSRQLEVELECCELGLMYDQAISIRKQLLIRKARENHWKLKEEHSLDRVISSFQSQEKSLTGIALELDLPPVSVFRAILARRVLDRYTRRPAGKIIQAIISESDQGLVHTFLSKWELNELQNAKKYDVIGFVMNTTLPEDWENELFQYLDEHHISYVKEENLKSMNTKSTPDCLLLDELYINGRKVKWIEFKSYYASGLRENWWFTKKIFTQATKYVNEFGEGAIIMKSGFTERLDGSFSSMLFLDSGPLSTDFPCID